MPRSHKAYVAVHSNLVANAKKASLMVQKEVKKKAQKTIRPAREYVARSKKLTKEVLAPSSSISCVLSDVRLEPIGENGKKRNVNELRKQKRKPLLRGRKRKKSEKPRDNNVN